MRLNQRKFELMIHNACSYARSSELPFQKQAQLYAYEFSDDVLEVAKKDIYVHGQILCVLAHKSCLRDQNWIL